MLNVRYFAGLAVAFGIGAGCHLANIPVPAPPALVGALLVMSLTVGYEIGDRVVARRDEKPRQ
jgi:XapX domain-containing protein